ncbi:MAG: hypothetical protein KBD48_03565 [Candidatus Pacebacteria bacterium]|nr:hypothetical protein [Candidatus Paceibacterota bacterium]MBP9716237.1 hypothetical protein [Candidatus Paceibacterota bacterium]
MNHEGYTTKVEKSGEPEFNFEVKNHNEGVTLYIFKGLAVAIDTTGKNYKDLPELFFGPYDNELNTGSLGQPEKINQGVDMEYASSCIKKVAEASGTHKFWFYPFGDDASPENKENREQARVRLFKKVSPQIEPAPGGYGYVINI